MERWIPCSNKRLLPNKRKAVLVTGIYGAVFIACRKYDPIEKDYAWWHPEYGRVQVKAWMPLPKPYKEKEKNNG